MTTKTDFHALMELKKVYAPKRSGFADQGEVDTIISVLEIKTRNDIELQNVRDFAVLLYGDWADNARKSSDNAAAWKFMDAMSAICGVIDEEKLSRGLEV